MAEQIIQPGMLVKDDKAPFQIMRDAIISLFGSAYLEKVLEFNTKGFAQRGIFGWKPNDANIVMDVSPMPQPWQGDWGYRIRFCAWDGTGDIVINEFYVPSKTIPRVQAGGFSTH